MANFLVQSLPNLRHRIQVPFIINPPVNMRLDALNRVPMHRVQNLDTNQKALQQQEKRRFAWCLVPNFYISTFRAWFSRPSSPKQPFLLHSGHRESHTSKFRTTKTMKRKTTFWGIWMYIRQEKPNNKKTIQKKSNTQLNLIYHLLLYNMKITFQGHGQHTYRGARKCVPSM